MKQTLCWMLVLIAACAICSLVTYRITYRSAYHSGQAFMIHEPLKLIANGVEVHTLMSDQYNALEGYLEAAGQTNAILMFRQYRCAHGAEESAGELAETLAILQCVNEGQEKQAIYLIEQNLMRNAGLLCNCYGGLYPKNRKRVNLGPLKQTRDYFVKFPHPEWDPESERQLNEVLRMASEKPRN